MHTNLLFDESKYFEGDKLALLESLVFAMSSGDPTKMMEANEALENLKENTNFWLQTHQVLQHSQTMQTHFFSLMSLKDGVKVS